MPHLGLPRPGRRSQRFALQRKSCSGASGLRTPALPAPAHPAPAPQRRRTPAARVNPSSRRPVREIQSSALGPRVCFLPLPFDLRRALLLLLRNPGLPFDPLHGMQRPPAPRGPASLSAPLAEHAWPAAGPTSDGPCLFSLQLRNQGQVRGTSAANDE